MMVLTVYGRFFKLYIYTALSPIPLSTFAGDPTQQIGKSFIKSYSAVCLEGAVIVLACIIFSLFSSSPPVIDTSAEAVTMVWSYVGELIFNMLVLVGTVKMADRVIREMMGLYRRYIFWKSGSIKKYANIRKTRSSGFLCVSSYFPFLPAVAQ